MKTKTQDFYLSPIFSDYFGGTLKMLKFRLDRCPSRVLQRFFWHWLGESGNIHVVDFYCILLGRFFNLKPLIGQPLQILCAIHHVPAVFTPCLGNTTGVLAVYCKSVEIVTPEKLFFVVLVPSV